MLNDNQKQLNFKKESSFLWSFKHEIIGIFLAALFLFCATACISFNPYDHSYFYFSTSDQITNWCGVCGAELAALLFYCFGSVTYLVLGYILFSALFLFSSFSIKKEWFRCVSYIGMIPVSAALSRVYAFDVTDSVAGGVLGYLMQRNLLPLLHPFGMRVVLWSLLAATLLGFFQISCVNNLIRVIKCSVFAIKQAKNVIMLGIYSSMHCIIGSIMFLFTIAASIGNMLKNMIFFFSARIHMIARSMMITFVWLASFIYTRKSSGSLENNHDMKDDQIADSFSDNLYVDSLLHVPEKNELEEQKAEQISVIKGPSKSQNSNDQFSTSLFTSKRILFSIGLYPILGLSNSVVPNNILSYSYTPDLEQAYNDTKDSTAYRLPDPASFTLERKRRDQDDIITHECKQRGHKLEEKLECFGVKGKTVAIQPGPVITLFEYQPEIDTKISKIIALEDDLAMALKALSIRIVAPIPGKSVVGFEIANQTRQAVFLSDMLHGDTFKSFSKILPLILGVTSTGEPIVEDLTKAPHVLVAGSTGSGKSVGLNAILVGLLCSHTPNDLKLILIDPKRLEFAIYEDIPHLLFPIITNPRKVGPVLKWLVQEMEERYDIMARAGVRSISHYRSLYERGDFAHRDDTDFFKPMPYIVVTIDELADLMMVVGKEIEMYIARIAQMARAAGIHMIIATQRPSVDVLTGVIKVNFPTRMAFRVSSKIDSRTVLDASGAEKLLGRGDMLFMNSNSSQLLRVHGGYVADEEIEKLTDFLRASCATQYIDLAEIAAQQKSQEKNEDEDELYQEVMAFAQSRSEISISLLQRRFRIGFNRSARLIEKMEEAGLISPVSGGKMRKVLRS